MTRNVTPTHNDEQTTESTADGGRFRLYRLCQCDHCDGSGKTDSKRCRECRGEGRTLEIVATATDPESLGLALVTLSREGEFDECPIGILDRPDGQTGTWLIKPWLPSARNLSDAGRALAHHRHHSDIV